MTESGKARPMAEKLIWELTGMADVTERRHTIDPPRGKFKGNHHWGRQIRQRTLFQKQKRKA
jgi:hypothetical protein